MSTWPDDADTVGGGDCGQSVVTIPLTVAPGAPDPHDGADATAGVPMPTPMPTPMEMPTPVEEPEAEAEAAVGAAVEVSNPFDASIAAVADDATNPFDVMSLAGAVGSAAPAPLLPPPSDAQAPEPATADLLGAPAPAELPLIDPLPAPTAPSELPLIQPPAPPSQTADLLGGALLPIEESAAPAPAAFPEPPVDMTFEQRMAATTAAAEALMAPAPALPPVAVSDDEGTGGGVAQVAIRIASADGNLRNSYQGQAEMPPGFGPSIRSGMESDVFSSSGNEGLSAASGVGGAGAGAGDGMARRPSDKSLQSLDVISTSALDDITTGTPLAARPQGHESAGTGSGSDGGGRMVTAVDYGLPPSSGQPDVEEAGSKGSNDSGGSRRRRVGGAWSHRIFPFGRNKATVSPDASSMSQASTSSTNGGLPQDPPTKESHKKSKAPGWLHAQRARRCAAFAVVVGFVIASALFTLMGLPIDDYYNTLQSKGAFGGGGADADAEIKSKGIGVKGPEGGIDYTGGEPWVPEGTIMELDTKSIPVAIQTLIDVPYQNAPHTPGFLPMPPGVTSVIPIFWHIPQGGLAMERVMIGCWGMTSAFNKGGTDVGSESLEVVHAANGRDYINSNLMAMAGIEYAAQLNLVKNGEADILITPYLHAASTLLLDTAHRGMMAAVFRHPVDRVVAVYNVIRNNPTNEAFADVSHMSLLEFVQSKWMGGGNWMTRFLSETGVGRFDELTHAHARVAKEAMRRKCFVGIYSKMEDTIERFAAYFGRAEPPTLGEKQCIRSIMIHEDDERNKIPDVVEGSPEWDAIISQNLYDMEVYEYALQIWKEQDGLFILPGKG